MWVWSILRQFINPRRCIRYGLVLAGIVAGLPGFLTGLHLMGLIRARPLLVAVLLASFAALAMITGLLYWYRSTGV
jgi:hypothetical protein